MQNAGNSEVESSLIDTSSWMSSLSNGIKLSEMVMPGSHDAGMSQTDHLSFGAPKRIVQTQQLNMLQQLNAGSRYFDIRVDYDHHELVTYHRTGDAGGNGQPLASVLDQSLEFIQSHNKEFFILKFSHIRRNRKKEREIKEQIDQLLSNIQYRPYLLTQDLIDINLATLTLGDCRGKMMLVFDYPEYISVRSGRFRYSDVFDKDISALPPKGYPGANITVYDSYSNTSSLEEMAKDQLEKLDAYGGLGKEYFFLLSWTLTPNANTFLTGSSVKKLAEQANTELEKVLSFRQEQADKPKPNIVYIDYMNVQTARQIIQYNF